MAKFKDFLQALEDGVKKLATAQLGGFEADALEDMRAFLEKTKTDLKRWTTLLAAKKITPEDFTDLTRAKEALAEMHALTQTGLALIRLEQFRRSLINLVIDTAIKVYL